METRLADTIDIVVVIPVTPKAFGCIKLYIFIASKLPPCLSLSLSLSSSISGRMGMLITSYLVLVNTSNSIMLTMPSGTFTALDLWLMACKCQVCVAMAEYALLLKMKATLEKRQSIPRNNEVATHHQRKGNKKKRSAGDYVWGCFPADPEEFCQFVDYKMGVISALVVAIFCFVYFVYFLNVLSNPPEYQPKPSDARI